VLMFCVTAVPTTVSDAFLGLPELDNGRGRTHNRPLSPQQILRNSSLQLLDSERPETALLLVKF